MGRTGYETSLVRQFTTIPTRRDITINGEPVARYVRRSIEENHMSRNLFSKSILENISLGKKGASHDEIMDAGQLRQPSHDFGT